MKFDLTLKKIKKTNFASLYNRFIIGEKLNQKQYEILLAIAICFINADNTYVQQLGYRVVVEYCNQTNDYKPLYEIAVNKGLYPISKFIEEHYIADYKKNFFTEWNDAIMEQYVSDGICLSEQQKSLNNFFESKKDNTVSIIAPTSYGKSELILSAVKEYKGKNICVLTPTKALLAQTKKRVQKVSKGIFPKIVIHPEMYNHEDSSCLAVLTQERLLRVFKKDPTLKFDCIIVDEAHEMLENNRRSHTLADVIIVAQKRNPKTVFKFLTPFISDSKNLKTRYTTYDIETFKVSEYIKTEKYFFYNLRTRIGLELYDQFLDDYLPISVNRDSNLNEEDVVKEYSASKNIIYLNKPTDIEKFALTLADELPEVESEQVEIACDNISEYLQPQYNLLKCLRKGIIYHHGSVPDAIRIFIEDLYKKDNALKYVISSSTLLSGVNLPAERMFILDNRRGKSNLNQESFKNLVGRVCRFSEIFNNNIGDLKRLEPEIYIVFGKYFAQKANCKDFLRKVAKAEQNYKDTVNNVLLSEAKITRKNKEELRRASEFIENYESGIVKNYKDRYTNTIVGKSCIMNGITEFDVYAHEVKIQEQIDAFSNENFKINEPNILLEAIDKLFVEYISDDEKESIGRLKNLKARNFYSMLLKWRLENKTYAEMINLFIKYWERLYKDDKNLIVYVGKWGDVKGFDNNLPRYIRYADKNEAQLINLAIVRIKEEQDFVDNTLIKFVEVLHDLSLIEERFYNQIKYGSDDERVICLIRNGVSLGSAELLIKKYGDLIQIDVEMSTVVYSDDLVKEMIKSKENLIQIHEIKSCM